jgi:DNA repair exonuclease SbcCD ATPase subunit
MTEPSELDDLISDALDRLRAALDSREEAVAARPSETALTERVAELERDNARLAEELANLRDKRDKDVAALDELIAQLKPLIEEV